MKELLVRGIASVVSAGATAGVGAATVGISTKNQAKKVNKKMEKLVEEKKAAKAAELGVEELTPEMEKSFEEEFKVSTEEYEALVKKAQKKVFGNTIALSALTAAGTSVGGYYVGNAVLNATNSEASDTAAFSGGYFMPSILR